MLGTNLELPNNWPHQLIPGKTCHKCHAAKPLEDFHRNSRLEGGHEHQCKVCRSEKDRLRRISKHSNESTVADKACKKCQQIKPSQQFQRNAITADGLHSYCRSCKRIADMEARIRTKRKAQESQPDNVVRQYVRTPGSLTCSNCHHQQTDFVRQYPGTTIVCQQCATFVSLPAQVCAWCCDHICCFCLQWPCLLSIIGDLLHGLALHLVLSCALCANCCFHSNALFLGKSADLHCIVF